MSKSKVPQAKLFKTVVFENPTASYMQTIVMFVFQIIFNSLSLIFRDFKTGLLTQIKVLENKCHCVKFHAA